TVPAVLNILGQHPVNSLKPFSNLPKSRFQILIKIRSIVKRHLYFPGQLYDSQISESCHNSDHQNDNQGRSQFFLDLHSALQPPHKRIRQIRNKPPDNKWHEKSDCPYTDHNKQDRPQKTEKKTCGNFPVWPFICFHSICVFL